MNKLSNSKAKVLTGVALASAFVSSAFADVTMATDGTVTGSLSTATFMGIAGLVITACAVMWAAKKGIALIR